MLYLTGMTCLAALLVFSKTDVTLTRFLDKLSHRGANCVVNSVKD